MSKVESGSLRITYVGLRRFVRRKHDASCAYCKGDAVRHERCAYCEARPAYVVEWKRDTQRTRARALVCLHHAESFGEKHGIKSDKVRALSGQQQAEPEEDPSGQGA